MLHKRPNLKFNAGTISSKTRPVSRLPKLYLSGRNEKGRHQNRESEKAFVKTKEYVWRQNNNQQLGGAPMQWS